MLYLLHGPNSFEAQRKIKEIKNAFLKKNPGFLIEEIDGNDYDTLQDFSGLVESLNLFSQTRLFIFKNALSKFYNKGGFFKKYADFFKESKDVFLFWEHDLTSDDKIFGIFQKNAKKIQEIKMPKKDFAKTPSNLVFRFADKIFSSSGAESLLALDEAMRAGIDAKSLVNVIFWKFKKMQKKDKRALDLAYRAILTDLNLKMDSKSEEEHLSRLAISVASKV